MTDPISNERLAELAYEASKIPQHADLCSALRELQSRRQSPGVEPVGYVRSETLAKLHDGDAGPIVGVAAFDTTIPLYASPTKAVTITDERNALLAEVISLIEDDMYGLGETDDVPERVAFNKALRRQINRITSRLIVSAALSSEGLNGREVE